MAIVFEINGALTPVPGVYSTFKVANSLPAPVPASRAVYIIGEAEEGAPGSELDIRGVRFTSFDDVKALYSKGSIVDAARMLFSNQPSPVFGGAVQALYVYKTNNSTRASKAISSPADYGDIVATRYGEAGNMIKSQIKTGQAESKPTKTVLYLPSPSSRTFKVAVNGVVTATAAIAADGTALAFKNAVDALTGVTATGGTTRTTVTAPATVDVTVTGDQLTITRTAGGTFDTSIKAGDVAYIPAGSALAALTNAEGSYLVLSVATNSLVLRQLKANEANAQVLAGDTGVTLSTAASDLAINAPVVITVDATTQAGSGATLELLETNADKLAHGTVMRDADFVTMLTSGTAAIGSISASVPGSGQLQVSLSGGSFSATPKVGDLVRIPRGSLLQGATLKNVGTMVVTAASSQSLTLSHLFTGMTTEAVSSVALNGQTTALSYAPSFMSTDVAARRIDSSAERKVKLEASRSTDGLSMPGTLIGGNVALELGYYQSGTTACTVTIDSNRKMTITPTGAGSVITVQTRKYKTLQDLADFLNTQTGVYARVPDNRFKVLSTSLLDMVDTLPILDGQALPAYNGRIKKDYADWKQYFADNTNLLSFKEGTAVLKNTLPAAETTLGFLSGGTLGSTDMSSVQAALDDGLKISARLVVPLFSRDAQYDIEDALTSEDSTYTIDSINAALKAHVATASSTLWRKERFGYASYDGTFEDAKQKSSELAYERVKMGFQRHLATNADGESVKFLPWMAMCAVAAGRAQSPLGTSMLRKPFLLSSAEHVGQLSLFTDTLLQDFNPDDEQGELADAIKAGLMVMREVEGFGVRMESPDIPTRSRDNDPQAWVYERENTLFTCDEVVDTLRRIVDNFIGNRTSDTPTAVVKTALEDGIRTFRDAGALLSGQVTDIRKVGLFYRATVKLTPVEALEAIILDVVAERDTGSTT